MRKVFLDNLPRCNSRIDWKSSIGYTVNFIYDNIEGTLEIINYYKSNSGKQYYITIKYENITYNIGTQLFKRGKLHALLAYKTYKIITFKYQINQIINDNHRNIKITDSFVDFNKTKNKKYYKYLCLKCGYKDGVIEEYNLMSGIGCACCAGKIVAENINDIPTTDPWMVPYFQGGYDEAKLYNHCSAKRLLFKCPNCNSIMKQKTTIANLYTHKGAKCPICSDGYSSIAKYFYSLLLQLKEQNQIDDFEMEKKFIWCSFYNPFIENMSYGIYDFVIERKKLIIEIDGGFHRKSRKESKISLDEIKYRDNQKDVLAINNGYDILRISDEGNFQNNIISSTLINIFDLSKIDWNNCLQNSLHTFVKEVCDIKYEHPEYSISDIRKIFPFGEAAIRSWLKVGKTLGWCEYNPVEEMKNGMYTKGMTGSYEMKPVICLENGKTFNSISECARITSLDFGCNISRKCVSMVCHNKRTHTRGYHFKFISDLTESEQLSLEI